MGKPRLLHLFNAFQVGGVERQHMMLVERLRHEFDQICWAYVDGPLEAEMDRIGVRHAVGGAVELLEMAGQADGIVMRTNRYFRQWAEPLADLGVPILFIRDYLSWYQGNGTYHDRELDRRAYGLADHTLFCGPELKAAAAGLPVKGGEYLYNTLDLGRFPMTARSGPANTPPRVAMLGNIVPRKNNAAAIRALRPMLAAGECELHIGGDDFRHDGYMAEVRREAEGLPVTLHGHIDDPVRFLADKDIFLMASTKEGWPVSIMEAMACGLPVISTDIGDIAALLGQGEDGLLVDDTEGIPAAVERLLDPAVYADISRRGVDRVVGYDADEAARRVGALMRSLIEGRAS